MQDDLKIRLELLDNKNKIVNFKEITIDELFEHNPNGLHLLELEIKKMLDNYELINKKF